MESRHSIGELTRLATAALAKAGASSALAAATARALVAAEMAGLAGHGLSRVALYARHLREGRASGAAAPRIVHEKGAACLIDASGGLAYLAMEWATREAIRRARQGHALRQGRSAADARANGVAIPDALLKQLRELAV